MYRKFIILYLAFVAIHAIDASFCEEREAGDGVCSKRHVTAFKVGEHENGVKIELDFEDCVDFGDVEDLIGSYFLDICSEKAPCSIYSETGQRITDCYEFEENSNVYLVKEGRLFMWPTIEVGRNVEVPHVESPNEGKVISVETLSLSPKVYKLHNFFSHEEAEAFIENALSIKDEANRLKRSSTGAVGYSINNKRTSENAFDGDSEVAMTVKRRAIELLGYPHFKETWLDGMQILRYNLTKAYNKHMDPFELDDRSDGHNFDSTGKGTNRYATILMYLSDVEEGGETVFPEGRSLHLGPDEEELSFMDALTDVREKNLTSIFKKNSWEEKMVAECRHRLSVKPVKGEAILFYSQYPDGSIDGNALHGGCPVLEGTKWAANLWIWNGPRAGYTAVMEDGTVLDVWNPVPKEVVFRNLDIENAQLYWEDNFFAEFPVHADVGSRSFIGHQWNIRVDNRKPAIKSFKIPYEDHYYEHSKDLLIELKMDEEVKFVPRQ